MTQEAFQQIAPSIPETPGIYKYYDSDRELLYVGKAKNLRKRVSSYFNKSLSDYKTRELVQRIGKIEFTIVNSEQDAFLLENSLIKQFQPRFNIDLKDDKSYPYLVIKNEPFPRIFLTRRRIEDGSEYLGPFTSVGKVRELLGFIRQHIPLRTCKLSLTKENIEKKKFRVCLEYHLGNCLGPCEGHQTSGDYEEGLARIRHFLKGNLSPIIQHYRAQMKQYAAELKFEKAEMARKKIEDLQQYQARSTIVNDKLGDLDVFTISSDTRQAFVNFLMVRNGTVVNTQTIKLEIKMDESPAEILAFAISHLRESFNSAAPELVLPFQVDFPNGEIRQTVPLGGDRKKLLELSSRNVQYFIEELKRKELLHVGEEKDLQGILFQMQEDLKLQDLPVHIECFDNSNLQGSYPVSAMVCFRDGLPSKKDYRHFNIRSVQGINDFASMKEVVYRRYQRLLKEGTSLPQLVIIDGGKGQLSAAMESIDALGLIGRITVIGLAKNEEEIFFPGDKESLKLPYDGQSLLLIRRIRDEVHRFGIRFHRQKRSKGSISNELESIPGVGKETARTLLRSLRSVKRVASAEKEELTALVGKSKANLVWAHFHSEVNKKDG